MAARTKWQQAALAIVGLAFAGSAHAALISVTQNSVPNVSSVPPQIEATLMGEESFAYVDRTHELTSARYNPVSGLLTTDANVGVLVGFPSYLLDAQYVANANANRAAGTSAAQNDYLVTYTVDVPSYAYLLLDNRLQGTASNLEGSNTTDPELGGNLAWVINDGWTRVNTGIMPGGQADYIGIDEGGTVSGPALRVHHDPGPGISLDQFFAIYVKEVSGQFVTRGIKQASGAGNMYVVAVQPIPEPASLALAALGGLCLLARRRR
jgi:hypothetical protein